MVNAFKFPDNAQVYITCNVEVSTVQYSTVQYSTVQYIIFKVKVRTDNKRVLGIYCLSKHDLTAPQ